VNENPKTKTFRKAEYKIFAETAQALNLTPAKLAVELGYADNSYTKWQTDNEMPYVASLACKALLSAIPCHNGSLYVLRTHTKEQSATIETLCKAMGLQFLTLDSL